MARKRATGNKSQAIRDALATNPDKSPKEIAEILTGQGFKLSAQYVSTIKSNMGRKASKGRIVRRKVGRGKPAVSSSSPVQDAMALIQSAGGLEQAQAMLAQIEQLRKVL